LAWPLRRARARRPAKVVLQDQRVGEMDPVEALRSNIPRESSPRCAGAESERVGEEMGAVLSACGPPHEQACVSSTSRTTFCIRGARQGGHAALTPSSS
jgi:hypothetical protein